MIALEDLAIQEDLAALLSPLDVHLHLVHKLVELPRVPRAEGLHDVILLPAECPDGEAWIINGILSQYKRPPVFLVYARHVDYARWSGVLDAGGTDMITQPFRAGELKAALQRAAERR